MVELVYLWAAVKRADPVSFPLPLRLCVSAGSVLALGVGSRHDKPVQGAKLAEN